MSRFTCLSHVSENVRHSMHLLSYKCHALEVLDSRIFVFSELWLSLHRSEPVTSHFVSMESKNSTIQPPTSQTLLGKLQERAREDPLTLASSSWCYDVGHQEICIFRKNGEEYVVGPTTMTMDHDENSPGMDFFTLLYRQNTAFEDISRASDLEDFEHSCEEIKHGGYSTLEMRPLNGNTWQPAVFVALGWLVERKTAAGGTEERTTNYVVLLNVTTDPISVWLVYDYHSLIGDFVEPFTYFNRLGDYANPHVHWNDRTQNTRFRPHVQDPLPDEENQVKLYNLCRFRQTCLNIQDECFCNVESQGTIDAGLAQVKSDGEGVFIAKSKEAAQVRLPSVRTNSGTHFSPRESEITFPGPAPVNGDSTSSEGSTSASGPPMATSSPRSWSTDPSSHDENRKEDPLKKCEQGFFGQPRLFDLALLAPDFQSWRPDGLDYAQTMRCLNSTHVRLGSTLRASSIRKDSLLSKLTQNPISIKDLCGNGKVGA